MHLKTTVCNVRGLLGSGGVITHLSTLQVMSRLFIRLGLCYQCCDYSDLMKTLSGILKP